MRMNDLSIGLKLTLGFALMIVFALGAGTFGLMEINQVGSLTDKLYNHPYTVGVNIRDAHILLQELHDLLGEKAAGASPARLDEMQVRVVDIEQTIARKLDLVSERYLGDKADSARVRQAFAGWQGLREETFRAWRENPAGFDAAANAGRLDVALADVTMKVQVMKDFALNKAAAFLKDTKVEQEQARQSMLAMLAAAVLAGLGVAFVASRDMNRPLVRVVAAMREIAAGDLSRVMDIHRGDEIGGLAESFREIQSSLREKTRIAEAIAAGDYGQVARLAGERDMLGEAINRMTEALKAARAANERSDWIKTGQNELAAILMGEADPRAMAAKALGFLVPYLGAQIGSLYLQREDGRLTLAAGYAFDKRKALVESIAVGEGLVGQAALEKALISITDIPPDYLRINSSFGHSQPRNLVAVPIVRGGQLAGVMELGAFAEFPDTQLDFLQIIAEPLAAAFESIQYQEQLQLLLDQSREQSAKLLEQKEELRAVNEELEEQTKALSASEEELKTQQEELQVLNEELEEKNNYLEQQQTLVTQKNAALDRIRQELELKAEELESASRYKSEFLANMSHELRTPLNSLLILSRSLGENARGTLAPQDVEALAIIRKSGNDLLQIINDVLDLSKIESGKMAMNLETVDLGEVMASLDGEFRHQAEQKGLALDISREAGLPETIRSDGQRLGQILRNLLSNAVKFTEQGRVGLRLHRPAAGLPGSLAGRASGRVVAFSVSDTGIGIPEGKQREIFEAFQQVDGSTSRKYGGTGLGLSICRELSRLLGGEITLASAPDKGSTFTLFLPETPALAAISPADVPASATSPLPATFPAPAAEPAAPPPPPSVMIADDRDGLGATDRSILVIEDDPTFATVLRDLCRGKGFKVLVAASGEEGLELADRHLPLAVILDIRLPGINGWTVLNALKEEPRTRHIPVHVMSGYGCSRDALQGGAIGFLSKPVAIEDLDRAFERIGSVVDKKVKDVLLVEDKPEMRAAITALVGDADVSVTAVEDGRQALEAARRKRFDCLILDLGLGDMGGLELLQRLEEELVEVPPVIVYTGKEMTKEEEKELSAHADSIIIKGVRSEDRLLDEVTLFLHQMVSTLPRHKQNLIINLHNRDSLLAGKTVLVVDDDMRNLFAVSRVLEEKGVNVLKAENGAKALAALDENPEVELVLLDLMMPVMDGYETLRKIRGQGRLARLPVIALTAKAMKDDREKCIAMGASDYLTKPVDVDRLLSMMRVWLYKK